MQFRLIADKRLRYALPKFPLAPSFIRHPLCLTLKDRYQWNLTLRLKASCELLQACAFLQPKAILSSIAENLDHKQKMASLAEKWKTSGQSVHSGETAPPLVRDFSCHYNLFSNIANSCGFKYNFSFPTFTDFKNPFSSNAIK